MHNPSKPNTEKFTRQAFMALAICLGLIFGLSAPALAETPPPGPAIEAVASAPEPPKLDVGEIVAVPLLPTATVNMSCDANTVQVLVGNKTLKAHFAEITVDGDTTGHHVPVGQARERVINLAENESAHIEVSVLQEGVILDATYTMDCILPDPAYKILADCDTGQAFARLINHGDDTAYMGVQYPSVMHMEIAIAPHSSQDWLLAVSPGETVGFDVMASNASIGSEELTFTCEEPAAPAPPAPTPTPASPAPTAQPQGSGGVIEPEGNTGDDTETDAPEIIEGADLDSDKGGDDEGTSDADDATDTEELAAGEDLVLGSDVLSAGDTNDAGLALGLVLAVGGLLLIIAAAIGLRRTRTAA
jgi:hypothetical protein